MTAKVKTAPQTANAAGETVRACLAACVRCTLTYTHTRIHWDTHSHTRYLRIVQFVNKNFATSIKFATEVISRFEHPAARRDSTTSKLTNEVTSHARGRGGGDVCGCVKRGACQRKQSCCLPGPNKSRESEELSSVTNCMSMSMSILLPLPLAACLSVCVCVYVIIK